MRPALRHRICARPFAICWLLGTFILWIPATVSLRRAEVFPAVFSEFTAVLWLLLGYACLSGLGFFVGAFMLSWFVIRVCRRFNGAPFVPGDRVTILIGPRVGTVATVYELTRGQGGDLLPRLDIGAESREKYLDIFDDYTLLRHAPPSLSLGALGEPLRVGRS
jgi:hypothetical protein